MKRWSMVTVTFFFAGAIAFAQQPSHQLFSSDLVLWSYMQEPQQPERNRKPQPPTPDPVPETQPVQTPASSQPGQPEQPAQAEKSTAAGAKGASPTAQTFTGFISKDADSYVLKVSETASYKLDSREEAEQYDGKRVRVTGTLDSSINLIHVDKIEPLS